MRRDRARRRQGRRGRDRELVAGQDLFDESGRLAVRAVVHARLLGLRLLTLDARVVLGPARTTVRVDPFETPLLTAGRGGDADARGRAQPPLSHERAGAAGQNGLAGSVVRDGGGYAAAAQLLAESRATLNRARSAAG